MFPHPFPVGVLCWMCRAPFYSLTIAQDVSDFLSALDEINGERDRRLSLAPVQLSTLQYPTYRMMGVSFRRPYRSCGAGMKFLRTVFIFLPAFVFLFEEVHLRGAAWHLVL